MLICVETATNRLLEMQSNGTPDVLIQNAVNAGYLASAVEVREVTDAQFQSFIAAERIAHLSADRDALTTRFDDTEDVLRALVLVLLDELNLHSTTINAMRTATTSATSLNDLKTRIGQVAAIPQRTTLQLRTAIRNKLGT